jgi:hypothetical protein
VSDPRKGREPEPEDGPGRPRPPDREDSDDEDPIDEALEESFPSSDPPASGQID